MRFYLQHRVQNFSGQCHTIKPRFNCKIDFNIAKIKNLLLIGFYLVLLLLEEIRRKLVCDFYFLEMLIFLSRISLLESDHKVNT